MDAIDQEQRQLRLKLSQAKQAYATRHTAGERPLAQQLAQLEAAVSERTAALTKVQAEAAALEKTLVRLKARLAADKRQVCASNCLGPAE
jgi:hypothetical protein